MRYIALIADGVTNNSIFDLNHSSNRDNCNVPFHNLRCELGKIGVELSTPDLLIGKKISLNLHFNSQVNYIYTKRDVIVLFETPNIIPSNGNLDKISKAELVFTWNDDLVGRFPNFEKINFPNNIDSNIKHCDFSNRDIVFSIISGNKSICFENESLNLYKERVKVIRWFEKNHPEDFHLYGVGWDSPEASGSILNKLIRRFYSSFLFRYFYIKPFPLYRGAVENKRDIYSRTKFAFCFENVAGYNGYITEKIFDCFSAGCVPIYWGADNINNYIPSNCFIDMRDFNCLGDLYDYLMSIDEIEYDKYQHAINNFIKAERFSQFSSEYFVSKIKGSLVSLLDKL
ncbi:glycosyltransferase family 10 domain-containing protein [Aeromonas veronii]